MEKLLVDFMKTTPFLFAVIVVSFGISSFCTLLLFSSYIPFEFSNFLFFWLSFLVIFLFQIGGYFLHKKFVWFARVFTSIVNTLLVITHLCASFLCYSLITSDEEAYKYENPRYYSEAIKFFTDENVSHFPKSIPVGATKVVISAIIPTFDGSRGFALKFKTNEKYINNELKKYTFKYTANSDEYAFRVLENERLKVKDFVFYVIQGGVGPRACSKGIGVNWDNSEIIYYYSNSD